ncbi:MAG: YihY/virulence factor BrkB family protein [Rhizomicrobium sp.]
MPGTAFEPYWKFLQSVVEGFFDDGAVTRGAAIAFYGATAIAPTLYIAVAVASLGFGQDAARTAIIQHFSLVLGHESQQVLLLAIRNAPGTSTGLLGSIIGLVTLVVTASGVFGEMEDALNVIWRAPRKGPVLMRLLRGRAVSLCLVIGLGFLLLISMVLTAGITAMGKYIDDHTAFSGLALALLNFGISTVLTSLLFAAIYKVVPNKDLQWRDVGVGAVGTALLFQLGQFLLGYYFGSTGLEAPYGAWGGLIVMLIWVYYSAQVFLLGAEFTKVYACRFGSLQDVACQPAGSPMARAA